MTVRFCPFAQIENRAILELIGIEYKRDMQTRGLKRQHKKLNGTIDFAPAYSLAA